MEHHQHNHHNPAQGEDQKEFFNKMAKDWDEVSIHEQDKVDYITTLLKIKGKERILDVGTGTGVMIPFYEKHLTTGSVLAVDFSENMIEQCRKKFPSSQHPKIDFQVGDIYDMTYEQEFDIVMSYSCFPHFTDHQKAIDIFARFLKQDGQLAIAHSSSRDHINHVHSHSSSHIQHDVLPSLEELHRMMGKAGLFVTFEQSDEDYHIIIAVKDCTCKV